MWRKNRQPRDSTSAVGTDINRNWPYEWEGSGSSTNPSAETYRGEEPGDTPENLGLRTLADDLGSGQGLKLYVDWHSYSQLILLPYGYSCTAEIPDLDAQMSVAGGVAAAIAESAGTQFEYGPTCQTIYAANGGSNDYVQDVSKA
jgi:carboxypeptidase A4